MTTTNNNIPENQGEQTPYKFKTELELIKKESKENMSKIRSLVEAKAMDMESNRAEFAKNAAITMMQIPIDEMQKEMEQMLLAGVDLKKIFEKYRPKMEDVVKISEGYITKIILDKGWIDGEALIKMTRSENHKIGKILARLNSDNPESKELVDAFRYAIASLGKENDMVVAKPKAFAFLLRKLKEQEVTGNKEFLPFIWTIMTFMTRADRVELAKAHLMANGPQNPDITEQFLKEGNTAGVFGVDEMEEIRGGQKYAKTDREEYIAKWKIQNNHQEVARKLLRQSYGTRNRAGEWLTLPRIGMFIAHKALWTTILGNVITDVFQGGKIKSFDGFIAAVTKPQIVLAGTALAAMEIYDSPKRAGQIFEAKDQMEVHRDRTAYSNLASQIKGNPQWSEWETFFKAENYNGVAVFRDYIDWAKGEKKTNELDGDFRKVINVRFFKEYLKTQGEKQREGKPLPRNVDYEKISRQFNNIETEDLFEMAKIIDVLGGKMDDDVKFKATVSHSLDYTNPDNTKPANPTT